MESKIENKNARCKSELRIVHLQRDLGNSDDSFDEKVIFQNATQTYCNNLEEILKLIDEEL